MLGTSLEGTQRSRAAEDLKIAYEHMEGNNLKEKRKNVIKEKNIVPQCIITRRNGDTHRVIRVTAENLIEIRPRVVYKTIEPIDVITVEPPRKGILD